MALASIDLRLPLAALAAALVAALPLLAAPAQTAVATSEWVRPLKPGDPLIWGRKDGILFGVPSPDGLPGPRGLIRIGVVAPDTGKPSLLNFVAVEPVTRGAGPRFSRMAFSELEPSQLDPGKRGKRLTVDDKDIHGNLQTFTNRDGAVERLSVKIDVETFSANHAHVYVVASIESDQPQEVRFAVYAHEDSPPIEELTLTATMGNYERLRNLWLKGKVIDSRKLYEGYSADAFVEHENYPLEEMLRTEDGDALAICTPNEADPAAVPVHGAEHWRYRLPRLTQYWRVASHDIEPDLRVRVNGRRVYWASHDPLPGGVAFENFEVRQRYVPGQQFTFGITQSPPAEMHPPIPHLGTQSM